MFSFKIRNCSKIVEKSTRFFQLFNEIVFYILKSKKVIYHSLKKDFKNNLLHKHEYTTTFIVYKYVYENLYLQNEHSFRRLENYNMKFIKSRL